MNDLQAEIDAMQRTIGLNPHRNTHLPGNRSRDYGTMEVRMTAHARGLDTPYYRGQATNMQLQLNAWQTVSFTSLSDPYSLASANGEVITLNETGLWVVEARAEYRASGHSASREAKRLLRFLVNDADIGLSDFTNEKTSNSFALHNQVVWQEVFGVGTQLKVQTRTELDAPEHNLLANINCRVYLVRCTDEVVTDSSIRLREDPPPEEEEEDGGEE